MMVRNLYTACKSTKKQHGLRLRDIQAFPCFCTTELMFEFTNNNLRQHRVANLPNNSTSLFSKIGALLLSATDTESGARSFMYSNGTFFFRNYRFLAL